MDCRYHNGHYDEFVRNIVEHSKFSEWLNSLLFVEDVISVTILVQGYADPILFVHV